MSDVDGPLPLLWLHSPPLCLSLWDGRMETTVTFGHMLPFFAQPPSLAPRLSVRQHLNPR